MEVKEDEEEKEEVKVDKEEKEDVDGEEGKVKHLFQVEERQVTKQGVSWYLRSEGFPLWLLVLTPLVCDHVFVGGAKTVTEMGLSNDATGIVTKAIRNLGWERITFTGDADPPDNSIGLAYGSLSFLKSAFQTLPRRSYLLLSTSWRRRSFPKTSLKLK